MRAERADAPMKIAILPGDGIGTEIVAQAERVLGALDLRFETEHALVGGAAYEAHGHPLPEATLALAQGGRRGAVRRRRRLEVRQARRGRCGPSRRSSACARRSACSPTSARRSAIRSSPRASSLKPELVAGLDILIIRELTGDIYFGQPRGRRAAPDGAFAGADEAFDTMRYTRPGDRAHRPRRLPAPRASAASG